MPVIATAGHVDHGKSALVQALTGTDPDRLREEKERGLTIDLGFAELRLPSGEDVSIVDVPGHERFIKNMLAGVGGIDLALLVVAADEGVMPQTREHLAIIDLLGIARGVIALTKADLVDDASAVEMEVRETLSGTTLADAPIVPCSAVTRAGLDKLLAAIESQLAAAPERRDLGRPRLPIDRAFTMAGFGTVVTGTLMDGSLRVGQEVEVLPGGLRARIRGLQNHGRQVDVAAPGRRTAVNLAGVAVNDLRRGMVLVAPDSIRPTSAIDVRLRAVPYLEKPVRHNITVTFHTGAAECEARLSLLDNDSLHAGESAWAQLRLAEPVVVLRGDRFIVRDPNGTLGGGAVVDTDVRRHRRHHAATIASLEALAGGAPKEDDGFEALALRASKVLAAYHRKFPLRRGMPPAELRSQLELVVRAGNEAIESLAARGVLVTRGDAVALPRHSAALTPGQQRTADEYLALLRATPHSPPTDGAPAEDMVALLLDRGDVVRVGDGIVFAAEVYDAMVARITERLRADGPLTLAQVRDMFGTTRRYAQALAEHMDAQRITKRVGDARVLR
jgi:selenocysteine-specific elongation factor